jgi:hypothetical protein
MSTKKTDAERFWEKVERRPPFCWHWKASLARGGYGSFRFHGRAQQAHRVAWQLTHGAIPPGFDVLHRCDTPGCVNPGHLFLGTHADNMADKVAKGRQAKGESITMRRRRPSHWREVSADRKCG